MRKWGMQHRDYRINYMGGYYRKHRGKFLRQSKRYYHSHLEQIRKVNRIHYLKNRELIAEKSRQWRLVNHKRLLTSKRKYYKKNRTKILARRRAFCRTHPEIAKKWHLQTHFGITLEQYNEFATRQQFRCAICKRHFSEFKRVAVDHDHPTKIVRGLLCNRCNVGIAQFLDNPILLKAAIQYLETWKLLLVTESSKVSINTPTSSGY
jgi:hypothetical protein